MSFVYFNSWMPGSFESGWTNAGGCVCVSGWSGLAAGLNNCLSSAAPPPPLQCFLYINAKHLSRTHFQCTHDLCVLIQRSCSIWRCFSKGSCCGSSTCRALTTCWLWSKLGMPELEGTRSPWSDPASRAQSLVITADNLTLYFSPFNGVVISLLYESLMLVWLKVMQAACWPLI